jgi:ATP-binding cassette, subfamily F, member 3
MLSARDLTLRRGPEPLFEQVNFTIFRGNKLGLTGANGTGKSSLFAAMRGELAPDKGDIDRPVSLKIAHVEQEIAASERAAIEFVMDGDTELRAVEAAIADAERRDAPMELAETHAPARDRRLPRAARAAAIMHGLGFKRPITSAKSRSSPAAGACAWRWRARLPRAPICCCSTSRPTIWIWTRSSGSRNG